MKQKAESIKNLVNDIVHERVRLPQNALITDFTSSTKIMTPKRLELIDTITRNNPQSVQELANLTKRTKQAVDRDLKLLERFEVISLKRSGRTSQPIVIRDVIVLRLKPTILA